MSSCAQSYESFDNTDAADKQYFNPPGQSWPYSYAAALPVSGMVPKPPAVNDVVNPATQPWTPSPVNADLANTFSNIHKELSDLQVQVRNQAPSTVTEPSTPDSWLSEVSTRMNRIENTVIKSQISSNPAILLYLILFPWGPMTPKVTATEVVVIRALREER
jgi:hypothetical protein